MRKRKRMTEGGTMIEIDLLRRSKLHKQRQTKRKLEDIGYKLAGLLGNIYLLVFVIFIVTGVAYFAWQFWGWVFNLGR